MSLLPTGVRSTVNVLAACSLLAGCDSDPYAPEPLPDISAAVRASANNVLSVVVESDAFWADSVAVRYGIAGAELDSITPAVVPNKSVVTLPVLGLLPETNYEFAVIAWSDTRSALGDRMALRTGALPTDLPRYEGSGTDPSPGFVVLSSGPYGLVIDNTGRAVWYHRFANGPGLNFMALPSGHYAARPAGTDGQRSRWIMIDPLGDTTRSLGCSGNLEPRFHDLAYRRSDGMTFMMCDEVRTMDLRSYGGRESAIVTGTMIQQIDHLGELVDSWSPFDYFDIGDYDPEALRAQHVNWTHGNSIALGAYGAVIVSFRNLSEITSISLAWDEVNWRFGGARNQFNINVGAPPFLRQHGVRLTTGGEMILLDNLGHGSGSRAERYRLNPYSAELVKVYAPEIRTVADVGGTTQDLDGGRILVAYGSGGRLEEYDSQGGVVWRLNGEPGYVFRAQRIRSLYKPGWEFER